MDDLINLVMDQERKISMTLEPVTRTVIFTLYKPKSEEEEKSFIGISLKRVIDDTVAYMIRYKN